MTKRRNNANRQGMPKRLRAALLASVAAVGIMTAAPAPAKAGLFGAIIGAVGGYFTGGFAGAAYGAYSGYTSDSGGGGEGGGGGPPPGCVPVQTGVIAKADKIRDLPYGEKFGEPALGCAAVETVPGNMEIQATKTAVEAALQTKEAVSQTVHQANMLAHSKVSIFDFLLDSWETFMTLFGGGRETESITWEEARVKDEFEAAYPENPVFETPEDLGKLRAAQDKVSRAASIDSKRMSAKLAEDVEALSGQLEVLEAERADCPGQTCVGDINAQIGIVTAQLSAKTALMQAAHNRVSESPIDTEREMKKAADAEWNRMIRGIDGGTGQ